jgi:hypothetical protein
VAAAILSVHDSFVRKHGQEYDRGMLFPGEGQESMTSRWNKMVARDEGPEDPRCPGNYAHDLELATLSFVLGVNFNLMNKGHVRDCLFLKDVKAKTFRRVISKNIYLTVSDNFPNVNTSSQQAGLQHLIELTGFWTFDEEAYSRDKALDPNLGFFELLGIEMNYTHGLRELPWETLECVVSKVMLDEAFGQARPSVFLVYEDEHYEALIASSAKSPTCERMLKGLDCIMDRLQHGKKCSAVLAHLMSVEMRALVSNNKIKSASVVYRCTNNDSLEEVCKSHQQWNDALDEKTLYFGNKEVLGAPQMLRSNSQADLIDITDGRSSRCRGMKRGMKFSEGKLLEVPFCTETLLKRLGDFSVLNGDDSMLQVMSDVMTLHHCKTNMHLDVSRYDAHALLFEGVSHLLYFHNF